MEDRREGATCGSKIPPEEFCRASQQMHDSVRKCSRSTAAVLIPGWDWQAGVDRESQLTCWKRMSICKVGRFLDTLGSFGLSEGQIKASQSHPSNEEILRPFPQGSRSKLILSGHILSKKPTSSSSMRSRSLPVSLMSSLRHKNVSGPSAHPILDLQSPVFDLDKPSW
jgi:hypothetical protein